MSLTPPTSKRPESQDGYKRHHIELIYSCHFLEVSFLLEVLEPFERLDEPFEPFPLLTSAEKKPDKSKREKINNRIKEEIRR